MFTQFEITTRCNFDCYYCAGRAMRQADMSYETFISLLTQHMDKYGIPTTVSLQGEGEPTLHKDFFKMAEYVKSIGSEPFTITNGSFKHPETFVGLFDRLGVSIDTLDEKEAKSIGRHNLPRTIDFIMTLKDKLHISIHSVATNQATTKVIDDWCKVHRLEHVSQQLQNKEDYVIHYGNLNPILPQHPTCRFSCRYLVTNIMRYYDLNGQEMPCCFIKSNFEGMDAMKTHQQLGTWSKSCVGCKQAN